MNILTLRHRSASGALGAMWEWDPMRQVVDAVLSTGSGRLVGVTFSVCSTTRKRHGAFDMRQIDGNRWRVAPVQHIEDGRSRWSTVRTPIHDQIGMVFLDLTSAPDDVTLELQLV